MFEHAAPLIRWKRSLLLTFVSVFATVVLLGLHGRVRPSPPAATGEKQSTLYQTELKDADAGLRRIGKPSQLSPGGNASIDDGELAREARAAEQDYLQYLSQREQQRAHETEQAVRATAPLITQPPAWAPGWLFLLALTASGFMTLLAVCTINFFKPYVHPALQAVDEPTARVGDCGKKQDISEGVVLDFYQLPEQPFGVTPDGRYLYMSPTHREALASLLYGVDSGCGFLALIAPPGLGKTTLLLHLLHHLQEQAMTCFLFQTVSTPVDLLQTLLQGLGVEETAGSLLQLQSKLKEILLQQARLGRRVVVVMDEAQNLEEPVLEVIRMLSNFETAREKLIQIIFSGQPLLAAKIASPGLEQLRQRVSLFARLETFSRDETKLYIEHRLRVAGYGLDGPLFSPDAMTAIAEASGGVPRNINNLCFHSLLLGCALEQKRIDRAVVRKAIADLDPGRWSKTSGQALWGGGESEETAEARTVFARSGGSRYAGWTPRLALGVLTGLVVAGALLASFWPAAGKTVVKAGTEAAQAMRK